MEYTLRDFQLCELKMLKSVMECLEKEGIQCYIIGGGSIGALRHEGFIPWDDDIDIAIMRCDFAKAEKVLKNLDEDMFYDSVENHVIPDAPLGHVYLLDESDMKNAPRIDIFAIDNVPDSKLAEKYQKLCAMVYHVCILRRPAENRGKVKKIFTYMICKFFPTFLLDFLQRLSYKGLTKWQNCDTKYVSNIFGVSGDKEKVPAHYFGEARYVKFEDILVPIPEKAEEYNTQIYGDFMKFPPEEKRVPSHFRFKNQESVGVYYEQINS